MVTSPVVVALLAGYSAIAAHGQTGAAPSGLMTSTQPFTAPTATTPTVTPELRGDLFMVRKMYREAIESFQQGPKNDPVLCNKIGIAFHQMGQLGKAKKQYERAVKLKPDYAEAQNNIGTVHYAQKSYRRAVNAYKKALKINPASASVHMNLGTAYFARKKYKEAFASYEKALSLDPEVFEHRNTYGVLLQERNVEERAKFHYYLARAYAKAGVNDRALQYLRKAFEEGLKDRDKIAEAPEFAALKDNAEFQQLLTTEPKVL
jgi:tetratricopeptide (TPR) repeat protein